MTFPSGDSRSCRPDAILDSLRVPGSSLGGTRKGSPNRSTLAGRALLAELERGGAGLPPVGERWAALLCDPDPAIRLGVERFLWEALYGRVAPRVEGPDAANTVRVILVNDWRAVGRVNVTEENETREQRQPT